MAGSFSNGPMAGVKLMNIVGPTNYVRGQKLNHVTSHLNNVETCVINMIIQNLYFGFCQTLQPNNGPVKLIQWVKIAHSFLQSVSNMFHFIISSLPM